MKIKKLIKNIPDIILKGAKDIEITGVSENSTLIAPGGLFIAKSGSYTDGAKYIAEAISAGAVAIATDIYNPMLTGIAQIISPSIQKISGQLAAHYYNFPSDELLTVGITGTNGKTTTSFLVKHLLDHISMPCGLIGTIEYIIGNHRYRAVRTTPDVCSNQKMLREMLIQGCKAAVMEVSSHALVQGRVDNINFDIALFTNLTVDHLDYHGTMEEYAKAKQKLFNALEPSIKRKILPTVKTAIVNIDSKMAKTMVANCKAAVFTYGQDKKADLYASDIRLSSSETTFTINYQGICYPCRTSFVGQHNVYNYMAAVAVGIACKTPIEAIIQIMETAGTVPGRLEPILNDLGIGIYVDFAHSDDALMNVLKSLQQFKKTKIITVFGCGGDRDKIKRPKMAKVAEEFSDFTIITSDNPRNENLEDICKQIATGFTNNNKFEIEYDRRKAIEKAVKMAKADDIILIAGKGHETYQIFKHQTIDFDDRLVAAEVCLQGKH